VHRKIAKNIAALQAGLSYAATLERDLRILGDIEKFGAAQMIVTLFDSGVDAAHLNSGQDGRAFRLRAVDLNLAGKLPEFARCGNDELMHAESDRGMRRIKFENFICRGPVDERCEN
jgi:hypothetical protein